MQQLTSADSQFLALETARQSGHVGSLAILDPSTAPGGTLDVKDIQGLIEERLPLLPPLRWWLAEVPFGLDYPYWVDDPGFDLDFHVRELALPAPGSDDQLAEQTARIFSRPLDRARPLWELYLMHGLESGHVAMLIKIHHSLIDGMSGAEIMGLLLDLSPEGRELPDAPPQEPSHQPGDLELLARGVLGVPRYVLRVLRALPTAVPNFANTPLGRPRSPEGRTYLAPRNSFRGRISPHRRFTFGQLSLDDVKAVKNAYGCTVNDVIVSICAGAVRQWLLDHGELPDEPLVGLIPTSVRTEEQVGTYGNRVLSLTIPLRTEIADPHERLLATHESLVDMKRRQKALPVRLPEYVTDLVPPALFSRAARLRFRLLTGQVIGRPSWNLVISNVPGPQFPLYCAGARVEANYPVSVITDGAGLSITVMSYCGHLDFGIVADRDQMEDVRCLLDWLGEELAALMP